MMAALCYASIYSYLYTFKSFDDCLTTGMIYEAYMYH